ncbi:hypothetical protein C8R45DRAFT_1147842 [Mycena sanguinolenta]|nr:hypothetical protein C8R45DRAFT_1147842 [Mycena sanguinolenta]
MAPCDIHSLPTETLCAIFRSVVVASSHRTAARVQEELERIANASLLTLSRVCSRWHEIAINNPTFWQHIEINAITGAPDVLETTLALVNARLERSRGVPLSITLDCVACQTLHLRIFRLLVQYSHRWGRVSLFGSLKGLDTSVLQGQLPHLKVLGVNHDGPLEAVEFFGAAPCLSILCITAPLIHSAAVGEILRRKQLRYLGCVVELAKEFGEAISLIPKLPHGSNFHLTMGNLNGRDISRLECMGIPSVTASITTLICTAVQPQHTTSALNQIFASLTLPELERLILRCNACPQLGVEWPHAQFLGLCERSNLGRSLKVLRIAEVRIAERDLLSTLSVLAALEHLEVGDAPETPKEHTNSESVLITDSFLQAMKCVPAQNDCLVPRLSHIACVSHLVFDPALLADFVTSRVARLSQAHSSSFSSSPPFHICIHPFLETHVGLISVVRTRLCELAVASNQKLVYETEHYIHMFP